jgi:hypothetical protein
VSLFSPAKRLAIEYQGIQHFEPVKHWGGEEALARVQERDKRKRDACTAVGIKVIYFTYEEELSNELVKSRLGMEK